MENKELIKIKFEDNEKSIAIPSDIDDLKKKFFDKFDVSRDYQYDFSIKLKDEKDKIELNNLNKVNFKENMDFLLKEENPLIFVDQCIEFTSSNFLEDNKSSFVTNVKNELKKEKSDNSNKQDNIEDNEEEEDDKNNYKENKDFINELANCESNIDSLINGEEIVKNQNYVEKKTFQFSNSNLSFKKYSDELSQVSFMQLERFNELEQKFELLKNSVKDNKDKIELKFKEMEKVYEKDNYIQELKKKYDEELMNEKNKYKELELKYEEEIKSNKKELEETIDKLEKENDVLRKKIEKYESDNQKIMEILEKQKK